MTMYGVPMTTAEMHHGGRVLEAAGQLADPRRRPGADRHG